MKTFEWYMSFKLMFFTLENKKNIYEKLVMYLLEDVINEST